LDYIDNIDDTILFYNDNNDSGYPNFYNGCFIPNLIDINDMMIKINKFKFFYYSNKFRKQFIDWLYIKVREPIIKNKYSPTNLMELLKNIDENDEDAFNDIINNW
jgi:hypothetical protein